MLEGKSLRSKLAILRSAVAPSFAALEEEVEREFRRLFEGPDPSKAPEWLDVWETTIIRARQLCMPYLLKPSSTVLILEAIKVVDRSSQNTGPGASATSTR